MEVINKMDWSLAIRSYVLLSCVTHIGKFKFVRNGQMERELQFMRNDKSKFVFGKTVLNILK